VFGQKIPPEQDSLDQTRWIPPSCEVSFKAISDGAADEAIDGLRPVLADHEVGFSALHQMGLVDVLNAGLVPRRLRDTERYYLVLDYGDLFFAAHSGVYRRVEVGWRAIREFFSDDSDSDLGGRPVKPPVRPEWTRDLVGIDPGDKKLEDIDFQIRRFLQNLVARQLKGRSPRVFTIPGRWEEGAWERGERLAREQIREAGGMANLTKLVVGPSLEDLLGLPRQTRSDANDSLINASDRQSGELEPDGTANDLKRRQLEAAVAAAGGFEWTPGQGPGIRFDPKAHREPGQVLKLHVTLEEMMAPGDKPNWGWVDPPKDWSEEEVAMANGQGLEAFAELKGIAGELGLDEKQRAVADERSKEPDKPEALASCPICGTTVSSGARVCGGCGTDLCPICRTTVSSNGSRCGACGWKPTRGRFGR